MVCLVVYVYDIILTKDNDEEICATKAWLRNHFVMKGLGQLHYFAQIEVSHSNWGVTLSQMNNTGMLGAKIATLSKNHHMHLYDDQYKVIDSQSH